MLVRSGRGPGFLLFILLLAGCFTPLVLGGSFRRKHGRDLAVKLSGIIAFYLLLFLFFCILFSYVPAAWVFAVHAFLVLFMFGMIGRDIDF